MGIARKVSVFRDGRKDWAVGEGGSSVLFSALDAQSLRPLCSVAISSMAPCEAVFDSSFAESGVADSLC